MPTPLLLLYPLRSGAQRAQIIEDLLDLAKGGKQAVEMLIAHKKGLLQAVLNTKADKWRRP